MPKKQRVQAQPESPQTSEPRGHGENLDRGAPSETASSAGGPARGGPEPGIEPQRSSTGSAADRRPDEPDYSVNGRSDGGDGGAPTARETD